MTEEEKKKAVEAEEARKAAAELNTEEDYQAVLEAKDNEILKIQQERDNYRKGMLKAKGKLPEDDEDENKVDQLELMRQIAREEVLATKESQLAAEKDTLIKKMAKDLSEAKLALKNRSQKTNAAAGSSAEEQPAPKDNFLSDEQVKSLKAKGWDDKKIELFKQNLQKRR